MYIYIYISYMFGASGSHGCTCKRFLLQPGSRSFVCAAASGLTTAASIVASTGHMEKPKGGSSEAGTHGNTKRRLQLNARQLLVFPVSWRAQGSGLRFAQHQHYVLRTAKGLRKQRACVKKGANVAAREIFSLVSFRSSLTTVDATTSWR